MVIALSLFAFHSNRNYSKWANVYNKFMRTRLFVAFAFSPTKACIAASVIFILDKKTDFITAPHSLLYFGIVVFFVYFKVSLNNNTMNCNVVLWQRRNIMISFTRYPRSCWVFTIPLHPSKTFSVLCSWVD